MGRSRSAQGGRVEGGGGEMESRSRRRWRRAITTECSRSPVGIWEGGSMGGVCVGGGVVCKGTRASATWASYSSLLLFAEQSPSLPPPLLISILPRRGATFPRPPHSSMLYCHSSELFFFFCKSDLLRAYGTCAPCILPFVCECTWLI